MAYEHLIGETYVDPDDSGDLVMKVVAIDSFFPDRNVIVSPTTSDRCWPRNGDVIEALIEALEETPEGTVLEEVNILEELYNRRD